MSWLDNSNNANCFKSTYIEGFIDVSGGSIKTNTSTDHLLIMGDASFNQSAYIKSDLHIENHNGINSGLSLNNTLVQATALELNRLSNATSANNAPGKSVILNDSNGLAIQTMNISSSFLPETDNTVDIGNENFSFRDIHVHDANIYQRLFVDGDVSLNGGLYISGDLSWNSANIADNSIPASAIIGENIGSTGATGVDGPTGATGADGIQGPTGATGADGIQGPTGASGVDGNQGPAGASGVDGIQGPTGANSLDGPTGTDGIQGPTGATGVDGIQGPAGPAGSGNGATGAQGPTGADGTQGPIGATGLDGIQGPTGPAGSDGSGNGATGAQGPTGDDGFQGPIGATGLDGIQGPTGATGLDGIQGPTGATGLDGPTGADGIQGPIGATGVDGIQGLIGATGVDGIQGHIGATGVDGIQGPTGATGVDGIQGPIGATGLDGVQGPTGATGLDGPTGADGIQGPIGATGVDGIQGSVGATGADGIQGPTGATGIDGSIGADGIQGPIGANGVDGIQGSTGDDGFQGSIGDTGADGIQGPIGATGIDGGQGPIGATGVDGIRGPTGTTGVDGIQGPTGATGVDGIQGPTGTTGVDGIQGPTGTTGVDGIQGPIGATGADGPIGADGIQGPTGATGAQGPPGIFDDQQELYLMNRLFVAEKVSFNNRLFVDGDVSLNSGLYVGGDLSWNSANISDNSIPQSAIIGGVGGGDTNFTSLVSMVDLSINDRLFVGETAEFNHINVAGDISGNNRVDIQCDASLNGPTTVGGISYEYHTVSNFPRSITGNFPNNSRTDRNAYAKTVSSYSGSDEWKNGVYTVSADSYASYGESNPEQVFNGNTSDRWVPTNGQNRSFSYYDDDDVLRTLTNSTGINWIVLELPYEMRLTSAYSMTTWIPTKYFIPCGIVDGVMRLLAPSKRAYSRTTSWSINSNKYASKIYMVLSGNQNPQDGHLKSTITELYFGGEIRAPVRHPFIVNTPSVLNDSVSIGASDSQGYPLYVSGNLFTTGTITSSDNRLKHNEEIIEKALDTICKLQPKHYYKTTEMYDENHDFIFDTSGNMLDISRNMVDICGNMIDISGNMVDICGNIVDISGNMIDICGNILDICGNIIDISEYIIPVPPTEEGFIAQEVENIPELNFAVRKGSATTPYGIDYNSIFIRSIKSIQELNANLEEKKTKIILLRGKLTELTARIDKLENA